MGLIVTLRVYSITKVYISPPKWGLVSLKYTEHNMGSHMHTHSYMNETRQISKNIFEKDKITCMCHHACLLGGPQHRDRKWEKGGTTGGK